MLSYYCYFVVYIRSVEVLSSHYLHDAITIDDNSRNN